MALASSSESNLIRRVVINGPTRSHRINVLGHRHPQNPKQSGLRNGRPVEF